MEHASMTSTTTNPDPQLSPIRTQVVQFRAEPAKGRQIEGPLALVWEPVEGVAEGQRRRGLACSFHVCRVPSCRCRDVIVQVTVVDDRIAGLRAAGEHEIAVVYEPGQVEEQGPKPWAALVLDLDSGRTTVVQAGDEVASSPRGVPTSAKREQAPVPAPIITDLLARHIDAELLEHLRTRADVVKGKTDDWRERDRSWFEPGSLVGWHEVFPEAADGVMRAGERWVVPLDSYCVEPGCKCREVQVTFLDARLEDDAEQAEALLVGAVKVKLPSGKPLGFDAEPGMTGLLRAAWKVYSAPPEFTRILLDRFERMKVVGRELVHPKASEPAALVDDGVASAKKPGRNDPCFCGSGKKYKKCCIDKA
jgi:hypothetical protein